MVGKKREAGDFVSLNYLAGHLNTSPVLITRAIRYVEEKPELTPDPPLKLKGRLIHRDEIVRIPEFIEKYKNRPPEDRTK